MNKIVRLVIAGFLITSTASVYAAGSGVSIVDAAWVKAMKAGDVSAAVNCYANDALLWVTGAQLAKGTKEIRAAYEGYFAAYTVKEVTTEEMGNETIGNKSVAWGRYFLTVAPKAGGPLVTATGRYAEVAKLVGGKWVYTVDHASDDPAPPASK